MANLLTAEQENFEGGTTTGWIANLNENGVPYSPPDNNGAISSVTTFAYEGSRSMRLLNTDGVNSGASARTPVGTSGVAVSPFTDYVCHCWWRAGEHSAACILGVDWYNSSGTWLEQHALQISDSTTAWTEANFLAFSPFSAAFASVGVTVPLAFAGGDSHYIDRVYLEPLTEPEPPLVATTTFQGGPQRLSWK